MNARSNAMSNNMDWTGEKSPTEMDIRGKCKTWKINVNCIRILDGTFEAGKIPKEKEAILLYLIYIAEYYILWVEKGILGCGKN